MGKQEKIREGMIETLGADHYGHQWNNIKRGFDPTVSLKDASWVDITIDKILANLDSQGVGIKVACPKCDGDGRIQKFLVRAFSNRCPKCNGYGYVAVEPLVGEK